MNDLKAQRVLGSLILSGLLLPFVGPGLAAIILSVSLIKVFTNKYDEQIFFAVPILCLTFFLQFFERIQHQNRIDHIAATYLVYVIYYLSTYQFLQKKQHYPMIRLSLIGAILIFSYKTINDEFLKHVYFSAVLIWAMSFFSIIKQCDQWKSPIRRTDLDITFIPVWNYPLLISYSSRDLEKVKTKSESDFLEIQKKAIQYLLLLLPLLLLRNYMVICVAFGKWVPITYKSLLTSYLPGDLVDKLTLICEPVLGRFSYLLTIFTLGLLTLMRVIFKFSVSVILANCFGFAVRYSVFEILRFKNFSDLMRKVYSIYARTIITLFYIRISNLNRKFSEKLGNRTKKIAAILIGGVGFHFILDVLTLIDSKGAFELLLYRLNYSPYLVILGLALLHLKKTDATDRKNFASALSIKFLSIFIFGIIQLFNYYLLEGQHSWLDAFVYLKKAVFL